MQDQQSVLDEIMAKINALQQGEQTDSSSKSDIKEEKSAFSGTIVDEALFDSIKDQKSHAEASRSKSVIRRLIDGEEDENDEEDEPALHSAIFDDVPEDIQDFEKEEDRDEIYRDLKNIVGKMALKTTFMFLLSVASLYMFAAGFYPFLFGGSIDNTFFRIAMLCIDVFCLVLSFGIFMQGLSRLLHARADTDTLLALLWLSVTVVRVVSLFKPSLFHCQMNLEPMLTLGLWFNVLSKKKIASNIKKNFKLISTSSDKLTVTVPASCETNNALILETEEGGDVMYAHSTSLVSEYIDHSYSDFDSDRNLNRFLFLTVIFVIAFTVMISQLKGGAEAILFPAAALSVSVPFFSRFHFATSVFKNGKKIRKNGGILTSVQSAKELEDSDLLIISEEDFLGKDSVLLQGVKALGETQIDDLITNIAALFNEVGTPLKPLFLKMIDAGSVNLPRVDDIYYHEGMGYSCLIHSKLFMVGNRRLMEHFNIDFPEQLMNIQLKDGRFPVFVSYQKLPAGIFIASYEKNKDTEAAIRIAEEERVSVGIVSNDFLFDSSLLNKMYPTQCPELFHFISSKTGAECRAHLHHLDKSPDLIASVRGLRGLMACLFGASKVLGAIKVNTIIRVLYIILSLSLILFMALSSYSAHTAFHILAFQAIWLIPVCAICTFCK